MYKCWPQTLWTTAIHRCLLQVHRANQTPKPKNYMPRYQVDNKPLQNLPLAMQTLGDSFKNDIYNIQCQETILQGHQVEELNPFNFRVCK